MKYKKSNLFELLFRQVNVFNRNSPVSPPAVLDNQDQTLVLSVSTRSNFFLMA